jgi:hypothetical protein
MIRALNSIYTQARIPTTTADKVSFAGYVLVWCDFTKHHHSAVHSFEPTMLNSLGRDFLVPGM